MLTRRLTTALLLIIHVATAQDFYYLINSGTCTNSGYADITDCTLCDTAAAALVNAGTLAPVSGLCTVVTVPDEPFWGGNDYNYPSGTVCAVKTSTTFVGVLTGGTASCSAANKCICADINECTLGTHNCDANAACINTAGGFTCACNNGYTGDGTNCVAITCSGDCDCVKTKIISSDDYSECPEVAA